MNLVQFVLHHVEQEFGNDYSGKILQSAHSLIKKGAAISPPGCPKVTIHANQQITVAYYPSLVVSARVERPRGPGVDIPDADEWKSFANSIEVC